MYELVPTIRDMRPYPESREAIDMGCQCSIARRCGKPLFTRKQEQIFAIRRNCPVHDNPAHELVISECSDIVGKRTDRDHSVVQCRNGPTERVQQFGHSRENIPGANPSGYQKTLANFEFDGTTIDREFVHELIMCRFLDAASNIVFVGETGTGKTHLAQAVFNSAIGLGRRGSYFNALDLVWRLEHEFRDGAGAFMSKLAREDILVIDELGYVPLGQKGRALLYHLLARLHEHTSVVVATHLPLAQWDRIFRDPHMTQVLIARFERHCHIIDTGTEPWQGRTLKTMLPNRRTKQKMIQISNVLKRSKDSKRKTIRSGEAGT